MSSNDFSSNLSNVILNHVPSLEELKKVFEKSLCSNFENVSVNIEKCPDLSLPPFEQQSKGFGSNMRIAEIGGPANLFPYFNINRQFDIREIARICQLPNAAVFGPGAGPTHIIGQNCEMVADVNLKKDTVSTRIAKIDKFGGYQMDTIRDTQFSLMANLALSDSDERAELVHFKASIRKGSKNLTNCIRDGLQEHFGEKIVSLAGQFLISEGKAKLHVMPHFPSCPFECSEQVDKWLQYFEMSAPLVCTTVMHSFDPGYHLRLEHTHCYSSHGDAGHYHYDTTPETIVYEGWFAPAGKIYRIDEI